MNKRHTHIELWFWVGGLIALGLSNHTAQHYTLCPWALLGWTHCLGCGIGRSIASALHGDWQQAWAYHPLGVFALFVIAKRIYELAKNLFCSNVCSKS